MYFRTLVLRLSSGLALLLLLCPALALSQTFTPYFYDIGSPTVTDLYVDPIHGVDSRSGADRGAALRTVQEAWRRIPTDRVLSTGYRIKLLPGVYGDNNDELPNYWELKRGTFSAPIILQAADGPGTVRFTLDINMANVSYFYLLDVEIQREGDTFHCERCDHILLRRNTLIGAPNGRANGPAAHETVKFNQSQHVYIESNVIRGAEDNGIDFVAVQYGHIVGNRIADTEGWCTYVKGGSAYIRIEANEFSDCFEGGVTAGQGSGLEFLIGPWFHYEAYDIKIINNIIHDVAGAALGVNGGLNILLAHNTAYRVGSRSHLLEIVFGSRSCDGDSATCGALLRSGAWGTSRTGGEDAQPIGNRRIKVLNNIFYNPSGFQSGSQHLAVYGPQVPTDQSIPNPQLSDDELEIKGNIFWNGTNSMPLGIEGDEQGCATGNPTCNETQLLRDNWFNSVEPAFINANGGDFRPASTSPIHLLETASLTAFEPRITGENTPEGELSNLFIRDRSGNEFSRLLAGAYSSGSSALNPPGSPAPTPTPPDNEAPADAAPVISGLKAKLSKQSRKYVLTVRFIATDDRSITSAAASIKGKGKIALKQSAANYRGTKSFKTRQRGTVNVVVTDSGGNRSAAHVRF